MTSPAIHFVRLIVCSASIVLSTVACSPETQPIYAGTVMLRPGEWVVVPLQSVAKADASQLCVTLPQGYRFDGATLRALVARDTTSNRKVLISGRFVRHDSTIVLAAGYGTGGRYYGRRDGRSACILLPPATSGSFSAVELMSSDTLSVDGLHWDTYYLNAFPPF
jgi:hypothetical protein